MIEPYREDLAFIHDAGFGAFALGAAPGILAMLHDRGLRQGLVVDLGCGGGVLAAQLCAAGYDVFGVDASSALLARARARVPDATFVHGSFVEAELPPSDAVVSTGECLGYLVDERNDGDVLEALFRRVHGALRPGGLFVFDVLEPGCERRVNPRRGWTAGEGWAVLVEVTENEAARLLTRHIVTFRNVDGAWRRDEETHPVRLHRGKDLAARLRGIGFRVRLLRSYGDMRLRPGHAVVAATKLR